MLTWAALFMPRPALHATTELGEKYDGTFHFVAHAACTTQVLPPLKSMSVTSSEVDSCAQRCADDYKCHYFSWWRPSWPGGLMCAKYECVLYDSSCGPATQQVDPANAKVLYQKDAALIPALMDRSPGYCVDADGAQKTGREKFVDLLWADHCAAAPPSCSRAPLLSAPRHVVLRGRFGGNLTN